MKSIAGWLRRRQASIFRNWTSWLQEKLPSGSVACLLESDAATPIIAKEGTLARQSAIMVVAVDGSACDSLEKALVEAGYAVTMASGVVDASRKLHGKHPSLIIVSGETAPDAYLVLRQATPAPILALLPALTEAEALALFATGVDDCQLSTISKREIILRVRALLRRAG